MQLKVPNVLPQPGSARHLMCLSMRKRKTLRIQLVKRKLLQMHNYETSLASAGPSQGRATTRQSASEARMNEAADFLAQFNTDPTQYGQCSVCIAMEDCIFDSGNATLGSLKLGLSMLMKTWLLVLIHVSCLHLMPHHKWTPWSSLWSHDRMSTLMMMVHYKSYCSG